MEHLKFSDGSSWIKAGGRVVYHHPGLRTVPDGELEPLVRLHPLRAGEILSPLSTMTTEIPWREGYNPSGGVDGVDDPMLSISVHEIKGYINFPTRTTVEALTDLGKACLTLGKDIVNAHNDNECSPIKVRIVDVIPPTEYWEPPEIREETST